MNISLSRIFGTTGGIIILSVFLLLIAVFLPFVVISGLNALFPALAIPFNVDTWAAVWILNAFIRLSVKV